ncbi:PKHJ1 protein, partial [Psilopogon haemacephalus]|nr:PKHJ1 protein [Psilopogon haemacephalus]
GGGWGRGSSGRTSLVKPFALPLPGFVEEPERKYCFECASEEQCQEWVEALKRASYEFMRRSLIFYRNEIQKMTGKDPLEQFGISGEARFQLAPPK